LANEVICRDNRIREMVPTRLLTVREAIATALDRVKQKNVETCWSDAGAIQPPEWVECGDASYAGGTIFSMAFAAVLDQPSTEIWRCLQGIGGARGWYFADWLWSLRGLSDRLLGGIGLRRGRRDPEKLQVGDALDFWRVLILEPKKRLQLLAEMRLPGEAILDFQLQPLSGRKTRLIVTAGFLPKGLWGMIYWKALHPVHLVLFQGMVRGLARESGASILEGPNRYDPREATCTLSK
jgi:hypothetical protein